MIAVTPIIGVTMRQELLAAVNELRSVLASGCGTGRFAWINAQA
jgi:hypothetical protein